MGRHWIAMVRVEPRDYHACAYRDLGSCAFPSNLEVEDSVAPTRLQIFRSTFAPRPYKVTGLECVQSIVYTLFSLIMRVGTLNTLVRALKHAECAAFCSWTHARILKADLATL